ncbi:MAG: TetR/AcrR family transcriptional regulator [Acholeplasmataceae bacterium]|jgi:AcrR family transcriptional regulator
MTKNISETKQNLMDAYWLLYSSPNQSKITVKMITDKAGYNRGTFYAYFLDIQDLHNQIEENLLPSDKIFEKIRDATFEKNGQKILEIFMQEEKASGDKLNLLLGSQGSLNFQTKLKNKLKELILKYAPLKLEDSKNVINYKANIVCSIFYETIRYWYDEGKEKFTGEKLLKLMSSIIFCGVINEKT